MKILRPFLALLPFLFVAARAQEPALPPITSAARLAPEELEKLLAPIALYPDALIAIILPASTAPADIVLAARQLRDNPGDTSQIEHRAWDESVKSLTSYPAVLAWMDENLAWTKQVGEAFATQPADVMQAMQRLRAQARAAGTLTDTPQQQVIAEAEVIRIVPAQPDVIYVPYYDPAVVFVSRPYYDYTYPRPFFTFGIGARVGSWLAYDCDWRRHTIWVGNRHRAWAPHDWHRPVVVAPPIGAAYVRGPDVRAWRPPPQAVRPAVSLPSRPAAVFKPLPFAATEARVGPPARSLRPTDLDPRHGELSPAAIARRPRPEARTERTNAPAVTTTPALPAQPALAPAVPPTAPATKPERTRENRDRGQAARTSPPANVQSPAPNPAPTPTPAPTTAPDRSRDYNRRAHAPAVAQTQSAISAPASAPAPAAPRASAPDYRGHSRSAPAAAPTPPPSAPASTTAPAAAPSNPPAQRGGRHGDRQNNGSSS